MDRKIKIEREMADVRIDKICALKIAGKTMDQIAEYVGICRKTVAVLMKSDVAKLKMQKTKQRILDAANEVDRKVTDDYVQSIAKRLEDAGSEALHTMKAKLKSENEFIQVKAASDLMDRDQRMSRARNVKFQGGVVHALVTAEQLMEAARGARELKNVGRLGIEGLPVTAEMLQIEDDDEEQDAPDTGMDS